MRHRPVVKTPCQLDYLAGRGLNALSAIVASCRRQLVKRCICVRRYPGRIVAIHTTDIAGDSPSTSVDIDIAVRRHSSTRSVCAGKRSRSVRLESIIRLSSTIRRASKSPESRRGGTALAFTTKHENAAIRATRPNVEQEPLVDVGRDLVAVLLIHQPCILRFTFG